MVGMIWEDRESGNWIIKIPNLKPVTKSERLSRQPEKLLVQSNQPLVSYLQTGSHGKAVRVIMPCLV